MQDSETTRQIRRARPQEAVRLSDIAFRSKAVWGYSREFMDSCREELTLSERSVSKNPTFVAIFNREPVGFYALAHLSESNVELGFLFVEPEAIGKGFGRELIEHAKRQAMDRGYKTLVIPGDPNAERFYRMAGARVVGQTPSESIPGRMLPLLHIDLFGLPGQA